METSTLRTRRGRPALRVRQKRRDLPNLRDHGLTCDRALLRILGSLQRRHGVAYVSERVLRQLFYEDEGYLPGDGTLRAALRRMERRHGLVQVRWIQRGGVMPDGEVARVGMWRIRVAADRAERLAIRSIARTVNRRVGVSGPYVPPRRVEVRREARDARADARDAHAAVAEFRALYAPAGPSP